MAASGHTYKLIIIIHLEIWKLLLNVYSGIFFMRQKFIQEKRRKQGLHMKYDPLSTILPFLRKTK